MKIIDPKQPGAFDEIKAVIERISPHWKDVANIVKIVPALKTKKGFVYSETLVLGFCVREKLSPEVLNQLGYEPIPAEIEGIQTDVIVTDSRPNDGTVHTKDTRSQMFDTLAGGMAVGNADRGSYGTLGMIVFSLEDNRPLGLTNEHVLVFDTDGQVGDEVQQPRFFLNSQVSIDPADCCPNGQLHYRPVENVVIDVAVGIYAACVIAAGLSDDIDPHRRGQEATFPDEDERTLKEVVKVDMNYPEIPFPGRPFKMKVKWDYERQTDRRSLTHSVDEIKKNQHYINVQELLTDKLIYSRGSVVTFYALLSAEKGKKSCDNYFVTAAALSPSHRIAYKIILKPFNVKEKVKAGHPLLKINKDKSVRKCISFDKQRPGSRFTRVKNIDGLLFNVSGFIAYFVAIPESGNVGMKFPHQGMKVHFSSPVKEVFIKGSFKSADGVTVKAYKNLEEVGSAFSNQTPHSIHISAASITHIIISGGNNFAMLEEICIIKGMEGFCIYKGQLTLAPGEELGIWNTYLFAQTKNDVPVGTDPLIAAQTIGGLPVTNNFSEGGTAYNIAYGNLCMIDINANGKFEVINPVPEIK